MDIWGGVASENLMTPKRKETTTLFHQSLNHNHATNDTKFPRKRIILDGRNEIERDCLASKCLQGAAQGP